MSQYARRREDFVKMTKASEQMMLSSKPPILRPFIKLWMWAWKTIYFLVSLVTYVGMIVGLGVTAYFSFLEVDVKRAVIGGLCTLLIIYVNKVNPK